MFFKSSKRKISIIDSCKEDKLLAMFMKNNKYSIEEILKKTGIESQEALRTHCWYLRKVKKLIDLRLKWGYVVLGEK